MRALRSTAILTCLAAWAAVLAAGCGGGSSTSPHVDPEAGKDVPAPPRSAFPSAEGKTLKELITQPGIQHAQVKVMPEAQVFYAGRNRYPFTIAEKIGTGQAGREIADAEAAIYYARVPTPKPGAKSKAGNKGMVGKAQAQALDQPAVGPFPAKIESLATKPPFRGGTTTEVADVATVIYSTELNLPAEGEYRPAILIKEKDGWSAKVLAGLKVGEYAKIPRPGDKAPSIETPTAKSVGGDLAKLSTRVPPDTQNKVNYAEVLGKEPILLLFTSPKFCQSRVCGPVLDVAQQAQHEFEGQANFIHMETFNENDPTKGVRPPAQVRRFHLPSEPWLFAINREGVVSAAIEGAFGVKLIDETVEKVIAE